MARGIRILTREALELHNAGKHTEALARAIVLAGTNPGSALALNLVGYLHTHASITAWTERDPGDDEAANASVLRHSRAAIDALSAAALIAPNCVLSAVLHAQALAGHQRFADALRELSRVLSMPEANHDDPAVHHVVYDLIGTTTAKRRKSDAVDQAGVLMRKVKATINNEIVPSEAMELLGGNAAVDQVRERAELLCQTYPTSVRAQLLRVYIELEKVRALDLGANNKRHLRHILALLSDAAVTFDRSLLIALFRAKVLFVLDEFDESEKECRRALRIEEPTDPNLDDIPPAVSVPGADYDARVSSVKRQLRVFLKHIVVVAELYWCSIENTPHHERIISVKVATLQQHYNRVDKSAAKTISDALRFLKNQRSWSFLICPNSRCDGKKFVDTTSLWQHMSSKHRDELWEKLQSVLGPDLCKIASEDDHSFDGITLCQDSDQHDIFRLPQVQDMFESLLVSPSFGIRAAPLAEMRQRKCTEGSEILEDIKEKLKMLPEDTLSTEFEEFCFGIQDSWLKFLKVSHVDYREVILPLARSFQWMEIKQWIANSVKDPNRSIGNASIDAVFGKVPAAPVHQSGHDLQPETLKPSCADETLKADEKCEESEVRVVDSNSGTMVDQSSSNPPTEVYESVMNIPAKIAEVELDKKGNSEQSVKETGSTSSYQQSLNVFNKNNADDALSFLSLIPEWPAMKEAIAQPPNQKMGQFAISPDQSTGSPESVLSAAQSPESLAGDRKRQPKAAVTPPPNNNIQEKKAQPVEEALSRVKRQIFKGHRFILLGVVDTPELHENITSRGGQVLPASEFGNCTHLCISGHPDGIQFTGSKIISKSWIVNCCKKNGVDPVQDDCLNELRKKYHQLFVCPFDQSSGLLTISLAVEKCKPKTRYLITPGTSRHHGHESLVTDDWIKLLVHKSYALLHKFHLLGLTLNGNFGAENLVVEEALGDMNVRFGFLPEHVVTKATPEGETKDVNQLEEMVRSTIFKNSIPGHELNAWLSMLHDAEVKDMMMESVLLMDISSFSEMFTTLYDSLLTSSTSVRESVVAKLSDYNGWQKVINASNGNLYLQQTFDHTDHGRSGSDRYSDNVLDLLRLLRNTRQHKALVHSTLFALVVAHHFPNLISDLQKALFLARKEQSAN